MFWLHFQRKQLNIFLKAWLHTVLETPIHFYHILAEAYFRKATKPKDNDNFYGIWHLLSQWTFIYFERSPTSVCVLFDSLVFWSFQICCTFFLCYRQPLIDALPSCATEACVLLMKEIIASGEVEEDKVEYFFWSFSFIPKPTSGMIESLAVSGCCIFFFNLS